MKNWPWNWPRKDKETGEKPGGETGSILDPGSPAEDQPWNLDTSPFDTPDGWIPERDYAAFAWEGTEAETTRKRLLDRASSVTPEGGGRLLFFVFSTNRDGVPTRYCFSDEGSLEREHICNPVNCARYPESFFGVKKIKLSGIEQKWIENALKRFRKNARECRGGVNFSPVYCEAFYSDGQHGVFRGLGSDEFLSRQEADERGDAFQKVVETFCRQVEACFSGQMSERLYYKASLVDPESGRCHALGEGRSVLGRNPDCALRLESRYVARIHAAIWKGDESCTLTDLHPMNGSYVNGTRLEPEQPVQLSDGDEILLATTRLIFRESLEAGTDRKDRSGL